MVQWFNLGQEVNFLGTIRSCYRPTTAASNFFIRTRPILIDSITHIGTRGMFVGAATEIEITYRQLDGTKKIVGYGTKNFLDPKDLKRVFDALITINPSLRVPIELVDGNPSR
jgi:hypothetical protein